jgi:hypothetical protein
MVFLPRAGGFVESAMRIVITLLSILFGTLVIVVAIINYSQTVDVMLWPDTPEYAYPGTSVSWVIFASAFAGFCFAGIVAIMEGGRTRLSNARLRAQVRRLQQELNALKRPSLAPEPPIASSDLEDDPEAESPAEREEDPASDRTAGA